MTTLCVVIGVAFILIRKLLVLLVNDCMIRHQCKVIPLRLTQTHPFEPTLLSPSSSSMSSHKFQRRIQSRTFLVNAQLRHSHTPKRIKLCNKIVFSFFYLCVMSMSLPYCYRSTSKWHSRADYGKGAIGNRRNFSNFYYFFVKNLWRIALFTVRCLIVKIDLAFRFSSHRKKSECVFFVKCRRQIFYEPNAMKLAALKWDLDQ